MINYKSYSEATTSRLVHSEWICHHIQIDLSYVRVVYYVSLNKISDAFLKYLQGIIKLNKLKVYCRCFPELSDGTPCVQ